MHSSTAYVDGKGYHYSHNGDYSGAVILSISEEQIENWEGIIDVHLPFALLKEIVGQHMMSEQISRIEDQTGQDYIEGLLS